MNHFFYYEHPETREPVKAGSLEAMRSQVGDLLLGRVDVRDYTSDVAEPFDQLITKMASGSFGESAQEAAELHLEAERLLDAVSEYFEFINNEGVLR